MSNVIEFKKRPEAAETQSDLCKAASYNLAELLEFEYTETGVLDERNYLYTATPETHMQLIAYFDAFGFDYIRYRTDPQPFVLWHVFADEIAGDVRMCLKHNSTWNLVRNRRSGEYSVYVEAVARQDRDAIRQYRHVAEAKFEQEMANRDEKGALKVAECPEYALPAETTMFERGVKNFRWGSPFSYSFPPFEKTGSGEYRHEAHDVFVTYAYVCGWSYADISRDKMRLDEVASICIGTLGYHFYQMTATGGGRWNKAHAAKTFPGCSDKLVSYLSACYGRRVESARKLRDAAWPELQDWARRNPFDRSAFGRRR